MNQQGAFTVLPNEILVVISEQLKYYELLRFESTSKYWWNYFKKSNTWKTIYEAINNSNNISKLPINYWWQSEELSARRYSTLLNVNRAARSGDTKTLSYITPPYKYYIRTIVENKGIIKKDLERLHARSDLSVHEKHVAVKLYWIIHTKFPRLNFAIGDEAYEWKPEVYKNLFPDELKDLADSKPLFYWEDYDGDNYLTYIWIFWLRSDGSITMYMVMKRSYQEDLQGHEIVNCTIEEFEEKDAMQFLFELPTGEKKDERRRRETVKNSQKIMESREEIYLKMSEELNWKLDQAAKNVIEKVKVSKVSDVKLRCDGWLSGLDSKHSQSTKSAIIRCLRRVLWFLLKKEIIQHSICAPAIYVQSREAWKEKYPNENTDHMSPKYWAFYTIEKAYYCVDPLTELLLRLLTNEETIEIQTKLHASGVSSFFIEKAVLLFHTKDSEEKTAELITK